jgi:hypothetical protein
VTFTLIENLHGSASTFDFKSAIAADFVPWRALATTATPPPASDVPCMARNMHPTRLARSGMGGVCRWAR